MIWIVLGIDLIYRSKSFETRSRIVLQTIVAGYAIVWLFTWSSGADRSHRIIACVACYAIDSAFYGVPTFTPLNFLRQNVFNSISLFYGANTTHFYFTQAMPFITLTQLPFVIHGFFLPDDGRSGMGVLRWVLGITVGVYSLLGHKEFRFIHPLLPILHLFAARSLVDLYTQSSSSQPVRSTVSKRLSSKLLISRSNILLLLFSLVPAVYVTSFHSVAQVGVMDWLRDATRRGEVRSVGMLMPCHSTPWQSHLHRRELEGDEMDGNGGGSGEGGRFWFITCEPPVLFVPRSCHSIVQN